MWRAIPLLKLSARMVLAGIVLAAAYGVCMQAMFQYRGSRFLQYFMNDVVFTGAFCGLLLLIPMTLATMVFFPDITRPLFYRFSMVTVSLLAVLSFFGPRLNLREVLLSPGSDNRWLIMYGLSFTFFLLLVNCSNLASRAYAREFKERKTARQKRKASLD